MIYSLSFSAVSLSTTPGTFKTVAGIIVPAGAPIARAAVTRIVIGPAAALPFDRDLVASVVPVAMRMLDNVIDINFYPTQKTRRSNLRHRLCADGVKQVREYVGQHATFKTLRRGIESTSRTI